MEKQTFRRSALGAFETVIMMPTALDNFSSRKEDALRSFIYPLLLYPLILWSFSVRNNTHDVVALGLHALTAWSALFGFYAIMYAVAKWRGKREYFWQYVNMANALYIATAVILMPVFLMVWNGAANGPFFDQYWLFYIVVSVVLTAFVITKSLRLNWYMGGFFAILGLHIGDVGSRIVQAYIA